MNASVRTKNTYTGKIIIITPIDKKKKEVKFSQKSKFITMPRRSTLQKIWTRTLKLKWGISFLLGLLLGLHILLNNIKAFWFFSVILDRQKLQRYGFQIPNKQKIRGKKKTKLMLFYLPWRARRQKQPTTFLAFSSESISQSWIKTYLTDQTIYEIIASKSF